MKTPTSTVAYWLASVRRFAAGATLDDATADDVLEAALAGIQEGRKTGGNGQ